MMRHGIRHTLQLASVTILAVACMFYPFMPGTHDRLAATLSMMTQVLGLTGLLMVEHPESIEPEELPVRNTGVTSCALVKAAFLLHLLLGGYQQVLVVHDHHVLVDRCAGRCPVFVPAGLHVKGFVAWSSAAVC